MATYESKKDDVYYQILTNLHPWIHTHFQKAIDTSFKWTSLPSIRTKWKANHTDCLL